MSFTTIGLTSHDDTNLVKRTKQNMNFSSFFPTHVYVLFCTSTSAHPSRTSSAVSFSFLFSPFSDQTTFQHYSLLLDSFSTYLPALTVMFISFLSRAHKNLFSSPAGSSEYLNMGRSSEPAVLWPEVSRSTSSSPWPSHDNMVCRAIKIIPWVLNSVSKIHSLFWSATLKIEKTRLQF